MTERPTHFRGQDAARYITAAQGAGRRAAALIHRLLAFSRSQRATTAGAEKSDPQIAASDGDDGLDRSAL